MATILDTKQCAAIKDRRQQINKIQPAGWMCEGADDNCNQFFDNHGNFFVANYKGEIVYQEGVIPFEMRRVAILEGEISRIAGGVDEKDL